MATITITFDHPQAQLSRTLTLPDAHLVRLVEACKVAYSGDGPPLTNAQALNRLCTSLWEQMRQITKETEKKVAIESAVSGVGSIDATG